MNTVPSGQIDRPVEPWRIIRHRVGMGDGPEQGLSLRLTPEEEQVELEVIARPRAPRIDQAQRQTVEPEAPARVSGDGLDTRGSPDPFEPLAPPGGDRDHLGPAPGGQLEPGSALGVGA